MEKNEFNRRYDTLLHKINELEALVKRMKDSKKEEEVGEKEE